MKYQWLDVIEFWKEIPEIFFNGIEIDQKLIEILGKKFKNDKTSNNTYTKVVFLLF